MLWTNILFVFLLNTIGETMKIMQTIFISKKIMKPVYFMIFIDSIIFTTGMKLVTQGNNFEFIIAYALGKVIGAAIGSKIEEKIALGLIEVTIFAKKEKAKFIADRIRELGFSVTTHKGYGMNGNERFTIVIHMKRKDMSIIESILSEYGYNDATMVIKDLKAVSGKISLHSQSQMKEAI